MGQPGRLPAAALLRRSRGRRVAFSPYLLYTERRSRAAEYFDDLGQTLNHKAYYDMMREVAVPVTSALNEETYLEYFEPILKEKDLLFIAFSSKLSSTIQAVYAAQEKLLKKYPERKFVVVDTLSISCPMTLLVLKAHEMYRAGAPLEEVAAWVENNKLRCQGLFTVDDLKYLKRGGRISAAAATVGTMLDLKPIIVEAKDGTLQSIDKVRGRKKAIAYLADKMMEFEPDPKESPIIILHADAPEDAERARAMVSQKLPEAEVLVENVGPVIGAHCGPGTVAVCFLGTRQRTP